MKNVLDYALVITRAIFNIYYGLVFSLGNLRLMMVVDVFHFY